jgi:hypothetical protein
MELMVCDQFVNWGAPNALTVLGRVRPARLDSHKMPMTKPSATFPNQSLPLEQYVLMEALPMETPAQLAPHRVRHVQQERRTIVSSVLRVITRFKADVSQLILMASAREPISLLTTTNMNAIVSLIFSSSLTLA